MDEVSLNINDLAWQDAHQYAAGAKAKELLSDNLNGVKAVLLKLDPGWRMSEHGHSRTEVHYILSGEYESQGKTYTAGTFRLIPKESTHGPFTTRLGAVVLVMWVNLC